MENDGGKGSDNRKRKRSESSSEESSEAESAASRNERERNALFKVMRKYDSYHVDTALGRQTTTPMEQWTRAIEDIDGNFGVFTQELLDNWNWLCEHRSRFITFMGVSLEDLFNSIAIHCPDPWQYFGVWNTYTNPVTGERRRGWEPAIRISYSLDDEDRVITLTSDINDQVIQGPHGRPVLIVCTAMKAFGNLVKALRQLWRDAMTYEETQQFNALHFPDLSEVFPNDVHIPLFDTPGFTPIMFWCMSLDRVDLEDAMDDDHPIALSRLVLHGRNFIVFPWM